MGWPVFGRGTESPDHTSLQLSPLLPSFWAAGDEVTSIDVTGTHLVEKDFGNLARGEPVSLAGWVGRVPLHSHLMDGPPPPSTHTHPTLGAAKMVPAGERDWSHEWEEVLTQALWTPNVNHGVGDGGA